jgi:hypothetical protein
VHEWLKLAGNGFYLAKEKLDDYEKKKVLKRDKKLSWGSSKKKYPMYFWPQIILEEVIKSSNKKQKMKIRQALNQMRTKSELSKRIGLLLD